MFNILRTAIIAAAIATTAGGAYAANTGNSTKEFGMATPAGSADRHVVIKPGAKWVNVDDGDTVEFNVEGKSFTWHFDTLHGESAFELSKIAPEGIDVSKVIVYVGANPLYRG
jgi:endonuclease YncB( thermonuclease family)